MRKFFGTVFICIIILFFAGCFFGMSSLMTDLNIKEAKVTKPSILFLKLDGMILDGNEFLAQLKKYAKKEEIKGVLIQVNSPGGVVGPKGGGGWDMEASAIVKGTKKLAAAKKVADWSATKAANELYSKTYAAVAHPDVKNIPQNYPPTAEKGMVKNDFAWMAENRERILTVWAKRYESKAAPK